MIIYRNIIVYLSIIKQTYLIIVTENISIKSDHCSQRFSTLPCLQFQLQANSLRLRTSVCKNQNPEESVLD